jgi:hypothetical protein
MLYCQCGRCGRTERPTPAVGPVVAVGGNTEHQLVPGYWPRGIVEDLLDPVRRGHRSGWGFLPRMVVGHDPHLVGHGRDVVVGVRLRLGVVSRLRCLGRDCDRQQLVVAVQLGAQELEKLDVRRRVPVADTEAPEDVDALLAQRTRWTYGTLQSIFHHRRMLFRPRYGWLGMLILPGYVVSVLLPLVLLPFVTVMAVLTVINQGWKVLAVYFALFMVANIAVAAVAVRLMHERFTHLLMVPIYRIVYAPLQAYLLYSSTAIAVKGVRMGWNKLHRTGSLDDSNVGDGGSAGPTSPSGVVGRRPEPAFAESSASPAGIGVSNGREDRQWQPR